MLCLGENAFVSKEKREKEERGIEHKIRIF
jgi:hypothetical protein